MFGKLFEKMHVLLTGYAPDDLCGFCFGMSLHQVLLAKLVCYWESVSARSPIANICSQLFEVVYSTKVARAYQWLDD